MTKTDDGTMYFVCFNFDKVEKIDQAAVEDEVIRLINEEREKQGLSLVTKSTELSKVARIKAEDMAENDYATHKSPTYGYPDKHGEQFSDKDMYREYRGKPAE